MAVVGSKSSVEAELVEVLPRSVVSPRPGISKSHMNTLKAKCRCRCVELYLFVSDECSFYLLTPRHMQVAHKILAIVRPIKGFLLEPLRENWNR